MNFRKLLLALFVLYWALVYGASFILPKSVQKKFSPFAPPAYRMYVPATTTNYDVMYEFYANGEVSHKVLMSEELASEKEVSLLHDKAVFIKRRLYLESLKSFDYEYQMSLHQSLEKKTANDFEEKVRSNEALGRIADNLKNYVGLYTSVQTELRFDSVKISAYRKPIVLAFDTDYKESFTYTAGEGVFYETWLK